MGVKYQSHREFFGGFLRVEFEPTGLNWYAQNASEPSIVQFLVFWSKFAMSRVLEGFLRGGQKPEIAGS